VRLAAAAVCLMVAGPSPADDLGRRTETGRLEAGDVRLSSGEYFDEFPLEGKAGWVVILEVHSSEFDAFAQMSPRPQTGTVWHNNDMRVGTTDACLAVTLPEDGSYDVFVTSATAAETGRYELAITVLAEPVRSESGSLSTDDRKLTTGEYCDYFDFTAKAGELWVIDVSGADFNTYLFGRSNDDTEFRVDNDDAFSDMHRSQVVMSIPRDGKYFVGVTSAQPGETGPYQVTMSSTEALTAAVAAPQAAAAVEAGQISQGAMSLGIGSSQSAGGSAAP
jgi:hypothetical protein